MMSGTYVAADESLNAYEQQRADRIARNQKVLGGLGFHHLNCYIPCLSPEHDLIHLREGTCYLQLVMAHRHQTPFVPLIK